MISFKQKTFTEYDALKSLYNQFMRDPNWNGQYRKGKIEIIDKHALIPILKGNNIVIERFVITSSLFGRDKYRMYLKLGAKVKMPENLRLPGQQRYQDIGKWTASFKTGFKIDPKEGFQKNNSSLEEEGEQRMFDNNNNGNKKKGNNNNNNNNNDGKPGFTMSFQPSFGTRYNYTEMKGEVINYNKKERSCVLEFYSVEDAVQSLSVLPFGLFYNIYLLNS